jgi:hypothetical protein
MLFEIIVQPPEKTFLHTLYNYRKVHISNLYSFKFTYDINYQINICLYNNMIFGVGECFVVFSILSKRDSFVTCISNKYGGNL